MFDSMQAGLPFNTFAAIDALQAAREMAKFDLEDTIIIVTAIIERFKMMKKGHKDSLERAISAAYSRTMSLAGVVFELGIKKFYDDPPPFSDFQMQLRLVDGLLGQTMDVTTFAALTSKGRVDEQVMKLMWDLERAHDVARERLVRNYGQGETPFELYEDRLGERGGYSDIHVARYRRIGESHFVTVAVKHLRPKGIDTNSTAEREVYHRMSKRLMREKEPWCLGAHHPHILPFLDFATVPRHVLISPWCKNGNISTYLFSNPRANRILLLAQTACGLEYLHTLNPPIVHADIKPDNILVNDACEAVLGDFGQARVVTGQPSLWETGGGFKGTPIYMAPELHEDVDVEATTSSDVYAFTFVSLQVLSGKKPFEGIKMNTVLAILRGIRPKQTDYSQASVLNLWPLLDLGWDADPERRPTMTEFLRRLKELVPPKLPPRQGSYESTLSDSSSSATTGSRSISRQVSKSALPTPESAPTAEQPWSNSDLKKSFCAFHGKDYDVWQGSLASSNTGQQMVVAIKVLRPHLTNAAARREDLRRFDRELDVWRGLMQGGGSLGVLELLDSDTRELYLASPWCGRFGSLGRYVRVWEGRVDALGLLAQVAEGLHYLHTNPYPILHNDLTPDNVYVTDQGRAVIAGFSNAIPLYPLQSTSVLPPTPTSASTTSSASTFTFVADADPPSSIRYSAPEVLTGSHPPSFASDVYSFALITGEVISLKRPYHHLESEAALLRSIVVRGEKPESPQGWETIVSGVWWLHDDILRRPSARECGEIILNARQNGGYPVRSTPAPPPLPPRPGNDNGDAPNISFPLPAGMPMPWS